MSKKVAAIAGASSGIGAATAEHFSSNGYAVSLGERREGLLRELTRSITSGGGDAVAVKTDMTVWEEVEHCVQQTVDTFGRIDVLINNVGAGIRATDFENLDIEEIDRGIAVNLTSASTSARQASR